METPDLEPFEPLEPKAPPIDDAIDVDDLPDLKRRRGRRVDLATLLAIVLAVGVVIYLFLPRQPVNPSQRFCLDAAAVARNETAAAGGDREALTALYTHYEICLNADARADIYAEALRRLATDAGKSH